MCGSKGPYLPWMSGMIPKQEAQCWNLCVGSCVSWANYFSPLTWGRKGKGLLGQVVLFELGRNLRGNQPFQPSVCNSSLVSKLDLRAVTRALLSWRPQKRAGPGSSQSCSVSVRNKTAWGEPGPLLRATCLWIEMSKCRPGQRGDLSNKWALCMLETQMCSSKST